MIIRDWFGIRLAFLRCVVEALQSLKVDENKRKIACLKLKCVRDFREIRHTLGLFPDSCAILFTFLRSPESCWLDAFVQALNRGDESDKTPCDPGTPLLDRCTPPLAGQYKWDFRWSSEVCRRMIHSIYIFWEVSIWLRPTIYKQGINLYIPLDK